jgi:hypothetical protein
MMACIISTIGQRIMCKPRYSEIYADAVLMAEFIRDACLAHGMLTTEQDFIDAGMPIDPRQIKIAKIVERYRFK